MELYEVAKQVDVIVVFALIYGIGLGGLMYCIMEMAGWCIKKVKQYLKKKKTKKQETIEE